ncbi:MAG TPA: YezD family protein [Asticcacaulis sp.]|nr:YezD family protein [Asticcacaulis sp.]
MSVPSNPDVRPDSGLTEVERHILQSLQQIRFGTLEVVIHDSRVVQIEKSEKVRFDIKGKPLQESLS